MTSEEIKFRWLRSKLLEYGDKLLALEKRQQTIEVEAHRTILLGRLEWVWAELGRRL